MKSYIGIIFVILFLYGATQAQDSLLTPSASTAKQDSLIKIGIALHDKGKFNEAIQAYESVLDENPSNTEALYEISYSCFANRDYDAAADYARDGLKYDSKYRPLFYLNLGNALDNLEEPQEAIEAYNKGMEIEPSYYLFPYNLGLTYYGIKNVDSARICFQSALKLNPQHPGSHLALANLYDFMNKNVPAVLAFSRFLILEPYSKRSPEAFDVMQQILSESVKLSASVTITVSPDSDAIDGDLRSLEVSLGLVHAARYSKTEEEKSEVQWLVYEFDKFFALMNNLSEKKAYPGFIWNYYVPYFTEMYRNRFTETFVHLILLCTDNDEVKTWIGSNAEMVTAFIEWNKGYKWNK
ncbi:MAG: tetratricopeptide repeat protein [bacterium]